MDTDGHGFCGEAAETIPAAKKICPAKAARDFQLVAADVSPLHLKIARKK
jgi:hypothetical protein